MDNLPWFLLVLWILLDLFLSAVRTALVNARIPRLVTLEEFPPAEIEKAVKVIERPRLRVSFRIALGLTHFLYAGTVAWIAFTLGGKVLTLAGTIGLFLGAMLILLMLEFLIDRLPLREPEKWSLALNGAASALDVLMTPLAFPLASLQGSNGGTQSNNYPMTEDELKNWMETEQSEGGLEEDERRMIYSIFQFGDTLCREIMVPRIDVHALEVTTPVGQAMDEMIRSGHSRVPVYEESIDNVLGLLYAKDLLKIRSDGNADLRKLIRPAYFVPESKKVDDLLAEMQRRGVHMAVVVDEYGGMAGLVTLEDIVEEIVGEIRDEYDTSEEPAIHQVSEDEYHFKGQVSLDDVNEVLNINLVAENSDSLGGFIYGQLGRVPLEGDRVQMGDWDFKVEEVRNRRIIKICAERSGHRMQEESNDIGSISATKAD